MNNRQLFEICPDCNGNGFIEHMAANPTLDETIEDCTRCVQWQGMVPVEPDKIVTTRYENMFGPCDFIDRIDVAEPGTYAIIKIGGDDES